MPRLSLLHAPNGGVQGAGTVGQIALRGAAVHGAAECEGKKGDGIWNPGPRSEQKVPNSATRLAKAVAEGFAGWERGVVADDMAGRLTARGVPMRSVGSILRRWHYTVVQQLHGRRWREAVASRGFRRQRREADARGQGGAA